jgi:hypothetical protein
MLRPTSSCSPEPPLPSSTEISSLERATRELQEVLVALDPARLTVADRERLGVLLAQLLSLTGPKGYRSRVSVGGS